MIPPVLAVEFGNIVATIILVISILSWFINVIQGNSPDGTKAKNQPKPKPDRNEIENLLNDLTGNRNRPQPQKQQRPQTPRPPKPPANRPQSKPNPALQRPAEARKPVQSRQISRPAEPILPTADIGANMRSHHLANRVDAAVEQDVISKVKSDIGDMSPIVMGIKSLEIHPLVKALRDPSGVRQAILLNEILLPPKGRRRH